MAEMASFALQLQDAVTATLAHDNKSVVFKYLADFCAGEDSQPTQRAPQPE
jgi:hypothetical protein